MRRRLYNAFDFTLTALFAIVIMPMLGIAMLVSVPAFRALQLMNRCRRYLNTTLGGGK